MLKSIHSKIAILLIGFLMLVWFGNTLIAHASSASDLDDLFTQIQTEENDQAQSTVSDIYSDDSQSTSVTDDPAADSLTDYLSNYNALTDDNLATAQKTLSPLTNIIGTIIGMILVLTIALIGFVTAVDLLYLAVPFLRPILNKENNQQMAGMTGYGRGSFNMQQPMGNETGFRLVSDEAIQAIQTSMPQNPLNGGGMPGMGMGMGMGGYGGGFGGGFGMQPMQQQQAPRASKSVISQYLKKRVVFLVVFAVAVVLLFSSAWNKCGINVAAFILKLVGKGTSSLGNINL